MASPCHASYCTELRCTHKVGKRAPLGAAIWRLASATRRRPALHVWIAPFRMRVRRRSRSARAEVDRFTTTGVDKFFFCFFFFCWQSLQRSLLLPVGWWRSSKYSIAVIQSLDLILYTLLYGVPPGGGATAIRTTVRYSTLRCGCHRRARILGYPQARALTRQREPVIRCQSPFAAQVPIDHDGGGGGESRLPRKAVKASYQGFDGEPERQTV